MVGVVEKAAVPEHVVAPLARAEVAGRLLLPKVEACVADAMSPLLVS